MYKCRSYILAPLAPLLFLLLLLFSLRIRPLKADFSAQKQHQLMREEIMGQNLDSDEQDKVAMNKSNKSLLSSMLGSMKRKKKEEKQNDGTKKSEDFSHDKKETPPLSSIKKHNEVVGKDEETQHSQVPNPRALDKVTPYKHRKTKSFDLSSTFNSFKQVASKPLRRANSVPSPTTVPENKGNVRNKGNFSGFLGKFTSGGIGKKRKRPSKNAGIADAAGGEIIPKTGEKKKKSLTRSAGQSSSRCLGLWGCNAKEQKATASSTFPDMVSQDGGVDVPITVQQARHIIADIYALQYYTDYAKNTLEEENETRQQLAMNLPFDVRLFLGQKMVEVPQSGTASNDHDVGKRNSKKKKLKRSFKRGSVKGFAVEILEGSGQTGDLERELKMHPTSATELFAIDAWRITGTMSKKHVDASAWTSKFANLAKIVDADCAKVGGKHGKGEHALCILARLFTFGAAIDHQVRTNQGQVYTKLDQQKAQWLLESAVAIFKHFVPISKRLRKNKEAASMANRMMASYQTFFQIQLKGDVDKQNGDENEKPLENFKFERPLGSFNERPLESFKEKPLVSIKVKPLENHKEKPPINLHKLPLPPGYIEIRKREKLKENENGKPSESHNEEPSENLSEEPSENHNEKPSENPKEILLENPYKLPSPSYMEGRRMKLEEEKKKNKKKMNSFSSEEEEEHNEKVRKRQKVFTNELLKRHGQGKIKLQGKLEGKTEESVAEKTEEKGEEKDKAEASATVDMEKNNTDRSNSFVINWDKSLLNDGLGSDEN